MKNKSKSFKVVLLCDTPSRELPALQLLKARLETNSQIQVTIIGSIGEQQRIYYCLQQIKPHVVFISQISEQFCRELSLYVRKSGGLLCVLPSEITITKALEVFYVNPKLQFDRYLDMMFLPGQRMKKLFLKSDISPTKLILVGSPKIDVLVKSASPNFLSRTQFLARHNISYKKKNIFVFTSFVTKNEEYIHQDQLFASNYQLLIKNNRYLEKTRQKYLLTLQKLCQKFTNYRFFIKPHPLEDPIPYQKISAANCYLIADDNLYHCLNSIDLAIHWSSTVATECWVRGIETIQYVPIKNSTKLISEFSASNPQAHSYKQLTTLIEQYFSSSLPSKFHQKKTHFINQNYFRPDGKAVNRITKHIQRAVYSKKFDLKYQPQFSQITPVFMTIEKMFGVKISRMLAGAIIKNYDWRRMITNYVSEN